MGRTMTNVSRRVSHVLANTAREAVFETFELLEGVLIFLTPKDIIVAQRTCKQFKYVIGDSSRIQEKLFMRPPLQPTSLWTVKPRFLVSGLIWFVSDFDFEPFGIMQAFSYNNNSRDNGDHNDGDSFAILEARYPFVKLNEEAPITDPRIVIEPVTMNYLMHPLGFYLPAGSDDRFIQNVPRQRASFCPPSGFQAPGNQSWRNMYLTSPPVRKATVNVHLNLASGNRSYRLCVAQDTGVTLGGLSDTVVDRATRLRHSPESLENAKGFFITVSLDGVVAATADRLDHIH